MPPLPGVHVWTLQPLGAGVLVHTQESREGDPVDARLDGLQSALDGVVPALTAEHDR